MPSRRRILYELRAWGFALRWGLLAGFAAMLAIQVALIAAWAVWGWKWR
jgi:hypothetical protein